MILVQAEYRAQKKRIGVATSPVCRHLPGRDISRGKPVSGRRGLRYVLDRTRNDPAADLAQPAASPYVTAQEAF
jgi:hypothetical protein